MKQFIIVLAFSLITQTQAQSYGYPPTALDQAGTVIGAVNEGLQYYNYNNPNRPPMPPPVQQYQGGYYESHVYHHHVVPAPVCAPPPCRPYGHGYGHHYHRPVWRRW